MNWITKLLTWLKLKEQTLAEGLEQFETIAPTLYARLKGYNYNVVMIWAFGQNWTNIPYSQMISTFLNLHPEFKAGNPEQIVVSSILDIIDLYSIKVNAPK
jgi:hypothetical protein